MSLRLNLAAALAAATALTPFVARATTLLSDTSAPVERADNTAFTETFNGAAGLANLSFVLDGYASLDGQNFYEDDFTLSLNGVAIIRGTWNMGGGGADAVYLAPSGATLTNVSDNGADHLAINWNGGHVNIATPLTLLAGTNTLTFAYHALGGPDHAGVQDLSDEGWSAHNIVVTQSSRLTAVPEPATWGLMIVGFGAMGAMLRRQRARRVALAAVRV